MPLLRADDDILEHIEKKYALLRLHVSFFEKKGTAQRFLYRGETKRDAGEKKYYVANLVLLLTSSFFNESLGFEGRCVLTQIDVQYSDNFNKVLVK